MPRGRCSTGSAHPGCQLLQDLGAGQTMEQAIERFGITFTTFESDLERRVASR